MKRIALRLLLLGGLLLPPALATAQQALDPVRFKAVLAAAQGWAADVSLVNYCLRVYDEQRPFLYYAVLLDLEEAMAVLKAVDAQPQQKAEFAQAVLANVRFYPKDAKDPALDRRCTEEEVEKKYVQNFGVSPALKNRPPLDKLRR
jgi:hypothetical protein